MRGRFRHLAVLVASLALLAAVPVAPTLGASVTRCSIRNVDSGARSRTLQAAVDAASAGDRLLVRGICHGITTIRRDLSIRGVRPAGAPVPTLDGDGLGVTLLTAQRAVVTMRSLTITGGDGYGAEGPPYANGGGIVNRGRLTLRDVIVTGNHAHCGGGISAQGPLVLRGTTSIDHNTATMCGGGIDIDATLRAASVVMRDAVTVHDNTSDGYAGGIDLWAGDHGATLTMRGTSAVRGNSAVNGGGILNDRGVLVGIDCASPGTRSHDNTPDDCVSPA